MPLREGPIPPEGWHGRGADLGEEHDPAVLLGPACRWELLAAWGPELVAHLGRRLGNVTAVWFEEPAVTLPVLGTRVVDSPGGTEEALAELCAAPEARLVLFARGAVGTVLRRLHAEDGLRDRLRAVVLVGADLGAERAWLEANFTHAAFDLEMARELRFFTLRIEGEGPQVLRDPPPAPRRVVEVHDLGITPLASLADPALARALVVLLAALE